MSLFTPAHRQAGLERRAEMKAWARAHLRRDFADKPHWKKLAAVARVKLPQWYYPSSPPYLRRYARKLGQNPHDNAESLGVSRLAEFQELNPDWPCFAAVDLMLERLAEYSDDQTLQALHMGDNPLVSKGEWVQTEERACTES